MADPAEQGHLVGLEAHARPAAEAEPAAGQSPLDVLGGDQQPGRHALDDHHQGASVGLSGGQVAQHPAKSTRGRRDAVPVGAGGGAGRRAAVTTPAWNRCWASGPPQRMATTAPAAQRRGEGDPGLAARPASRPSGPARTRSPITKPARKAR